MRPIIPPRRAQSLFVSTTLRLGRWLSTSPEDRLGETGTTSPLPGPTPLKSIVPRSPRRDTRFAVMEAATAPRQDGRARTSRSLNELTVPGPGEWQLRVWREDAAGNHEPSNASVLCRSGSILSRRSSPSSRRRPRTQRWSRSRSTDELSGVASGQIELSRQGTGTWQSLVTARKGDRLLARIDDSLLPAGDYVLRATAWDHASNQNSTDRRSVGNPWLSACRYVCRPWFGLECKPSGRFDGQSSAEAGAARLGDE